jgi:hypothetical protein
MINNRPLVTIMVIGGLFSAPSFAGPNNLDITNLVDTQGNANNNDFEGLAKELSNVITSVNLAPAETPGLSGFDFALDYSFHDISEDQSYWKNSLTGRFENRSPPVGLQTLGVKARKGFILPIPQSTEIELGATWIGDSNLWSLGGNLRLGLYEMGSFNTNYWMTWIPDIAISAGGNRLVGTSQVDLVTLIGGLTVSKNFAIAGDFSFAPFYSYQRIYLDASSDTIDPDPSDPTDVDRNIVFDRLDLEDAWTQDQFSVRKTGGIRVIFGVVELGLGYAVTEYEVGGIAKSMNHYNFRGGLNF